jgi:hypothetical protein
MHSSPFEFQRGAGARCYFTRQTRDLQVPSSKRRHLNVPSAKPRSFRSFLYAATSTRTESYPRPSFTDCSGFNSSRSHHRSRLAVRRGGSGIPSSATASPTVPCFPNLPRHFPDATSTGQSPSKSVGTSRFFRVILKVPGKSRKDAGAGITAAGLSAQASIASEGPQGTARGRYRLWRGRRALE